MQQADTVATMSEVRLDAELQALRASKRWPARVDMAGCVAVGSIVTDRVLVVVILGNLVDNALRYSIPDAPLTLTAIASTRDGVPGVAIACRNAVGAAGLPDPALAERLGGSLSYSTEGGDAVFVLWLPDGRLA